MMMTQCGFEQFMEAASEGWSWLAVRTNLERLARGLQRRSDVLIYEPEASYRRLQGHPVLRDELGRRQAFALQLVGAPWSVLLRTVDWVTTGDALAVRRMAAELSSDLVTEAVASVGAYGGAECRCFRFGKEVGCVDSDDPASGLFEFLEERDLWLPPCFIGTEGERATLYVEPLAGLQLRRVDRVVLRMNSSAR
ncbi:MAG: hypothetical protein U0939_15670 [Pirellulales bacterium]